MSSATQLSHRRLVTTVLALLLVASTAACGTSGGDDTAATTTKAPSTTDAPDGSDTSEVSPTSETEQTSTTTERTSTTAGGKASGSEQDYIDALVGSFDPEEDGEDFTKDEVACLANGWVRAVGVETFEKAGVSPDDIANNGEDFNDMNLSEAQANDMVDVYESCGIDVKQLMLKSFVSDAATPAQQACIKKALTDDAVRALLVDSIVNDSGTSSPLMKTLTACMR